jgi:hypothetical protein
MLSDDLIQLLTAHVDGHLTQRQRKAVARLLHRSPEARALLSQLLDDARQIRQLPRRKVEPSLVPTVLESIAEQGLHITLPPRPVARRRWLPYSVAAMAASLLVAALAGLWFFAAETEHPTIVTLKETKPETKPAPERAPESPARKPNPLIKDLVEGVVQNFAAPIPAEREGPYSVAFRELQKDLAMDGLVAQLEKGRAIHLDVTVKNNPLALERLQGVLQENGIKVVLDPHAKKSLKQDAGKHEFLVYADNLRTDELTRILRELGRDDNKLQKFQRTPFERVTLTPLTEKEKKHVSTLIGADPAKMESPGDAKNEPKFNNWERSAAILAPGQPARVSTEMKNFAGQLHPQPGTFQVLVRIRQEK